MNNVEYYSKATNEAREVHCNSQCKDKDPDCLFYCKWMGWKDNDIRLDIEFGKKKASDGWFPQNECEKMKKQGQWWMGQGKYRGGCYSWDYDCLNQCLGSTWEYNLLALSKKTGALSLIFNPNDMDNIDYYSVENNHARRELCINKCAGDFDCEWYCG